MTTSTLDVSELSSGPRAHGTERQLQRIAGVGRVLVNPISGLTTVVYDPGNTLSCWANLAIPDGHLRQMDLGDREVCAALKDFGTALEITPQGRQ